MRALWTVNGARYVSSPVPLSLYKQLRYGTWRASSPEPVSLQHRLRYIKVRERGEGDVIAVFIDFSLSRMFGRFRMDGIVPQDVLVCANTSLTSLTGHGSALWSGKEWVH